MVLKSFFKLINIPVFIISLALGLFFAYVTMPKLTTIYVYPNPLTKEKVLYKDATDTCFKFDEVSVECPVDKSKINVVPIQT